MQDLVIEFTDDKSPLYEQIYRHIREEIRKGALRYGEKLPSTRSLSAYLQVSRATVELAYDQLRAEGYVEAIPYKGYYVARVEELYRLDRAGAGIREKELDRGKGYTVDFSPHGIDMGAFPFGIWRKLTKNALSQDKKEMFALGEPKGDLRLRETIARYLHASRGVNCTPRQIIVGAGNDFLLLLLRHILGERCCVAFENPTYPRAFQIFEMFSGRLATVPSDEGGLRVEALDAVGAQAVYVMPSHQYPKGVAMPIGRRLELLHWASQGIGRYVIEDDYDSEFRYRGKPIPSLQASDRQGKVVYIGTFSKSIAPAIRIGFMVLPEPLMERYEQKYTFFSSTVSRIDQAVLDAFIRDGAFERHLNRMRKIYKEKHEALLEELRYLEKDFLLSGENAGLHVLLTDRRGRKEQMLKAAAAKEGVRIYGMSEALVRPLAEAEKFPATLLLGFGGLETQEIRKGVALLRKAFARFT